MLATLTVTVSTVSLLIGAKLHHMRRLVVPMTVKTVDELMDQKEMHEKSSSVPFRWLYDYDDYI